jgi:hypothetical protein
LTAFVAVTTATLLPILPGLVATAIAMIAWVIGRRGMIRVSHGPETLYEITGVVRGWPNVVGVVTVAAAALIAVLAGQALNLGIGVAVIVSAVMLANWAGMIFAVAELSWMVGAHWSHFFSKTAMVAATAQSVTVVAAACAPLWIDWLGYVLIGFAAILTWIAYQKAGYLVM